jgi:hypothetical protein
MNFPRQRCAIFLGLLLAVYSVRSQSAADGPRVIRSFSGQFVVTASPEFSLLLHRPELAANANLVRLEPSLLAIAAERFKASLWHEFGLPPGAAWSGKIFLQLRPARTLDDEVLISSSVFARTWNYRLELPDVLPCQRYARALATGLLLEMANRNNPAGSDHAAEIPPWLAAGLAQEALADDAAKIILSAPAKTVDGLVQSRSVQIEHGFDSLAGVRRALQNTPALTFDQLSWPDDDQLNGNDGGVYLASAQLFVHELLAVKNGPAKGRDLLARLPGCLNWQTAMLAAFHDDFPRLLDVEKWWAIRVVAFAAQATGPRWPAETSRSRLTELLAVPVAFRSDSNALPVHADISLQSALQNFAPASRDAVLQTKLRDLQLAEFRLAPPFDALADGYRAALADFFEKNKSSASSASAGKHPAGLDQAVGIAETLKKIDALDARRREVEAKFDSLPQNLNRIAP